MQIKDLPSSFPALQLQANNAFTKAAQRRIMARGAVLQHSATENSRTKASGESHGCQRMQTRAVFEPNDRPCVFGRVPFLGRGWINCSASGRHHFCVSTDNAWNHDGDSAGKQGLPHAQTRVSSRIKERLWVNRAYGRSPYFDRFSASTTDAYFS
jgi:hypothetical protein